MAIRRAISRWWSTLKRKWRSPACQWLKVQNDIIIDWRIPARAGLVLGRIVKPGQKVAIESPTYCGFLNLLIAQQNRLCADPGGRPRDGYGISGRRADSRRSQSCYHHPDLPQPDRRHDDRRDGASICCGLPRATALPIIEDDWGRLLRYEGEAPPPLKAMDPGGYVIHIGTFSKCFLTGLRIGWITCPLR